MNLVRWIPFRSSQEDHCSYGQFCVALVKTVVILLVLLGGQSFFSATYAQSLSQSGWSPLFLEPIYFRLPEAQSQLSLSSSPTILASSRDRDVGPDSSDSETEEAEAHSDAGLTLSEQNFGMFSGRLFTNAYFPTTQVWTNSYQQISASFWLNLDPHIDEWSSAHITFVGNQIVASSTASVAGNVAPGGGSVLGFQPALREGFLEYSREGKVFKAGQMILPWGKSDAVNPTDFLSAKDATFFDPDEEVRRVGGLSVFASYTPNEGNSPWTFTLVRTAVFPKSTLLLAPGQVPAGLAGVGTVATPETNWMNSETALKIAVSGTFWDASLSVFKGWNHLPYFEVTALAGTLVNPSVSVQQTFQRITALGLDGSFTFGNWITRTEAAYVWTENNDGQNPLIQPSHLDAVVGVERPLWGDFRLGVQGLLRVYPRFLAPSEVVGTDPLSTAVFREVAQINALIQNYQESIRPSASVRLSYTNEVSGLEAEVFAIGNLLGGGMLLKPQVSYHWTDVLKLTAGLDYFFGPADRPLGVLAPYSALYSQFKYSF